eukprot:46140-Chlamydomonas_euryale.AAC.1
MHTVNSVAAGRLSFHLGLRGPSLVVDTACSSSLVATSLALRHCQEACGNSGSEIGGDGGQGGHMSGSSSVRESGCAAHALVGGVNMLLLPSTSNMFVAAGMLSPEGRCKTLDERADGYVRAEACVAVLLTPSSQRGGGNAGTSTVLALLVGAAVNQDGRSSSLTAPN